MHHLTNANASHFKTDVGKKIGAVTVAPPNEAEAEFMQVLSGGDSSYEHLS